MALTLRMMLHSVHDVPPVEADLLDAVSADRHVGVARLVQLAEAGPGRARVVPPHNDGSSADGVLLVPNVMRLVRQRGMDDGKL